eukprot:TRINITY_DN9300_c0_g1_i1.p1 TRINITY_DN9300_c0_g1~~TRINITY_DN9300_c0_g1_i1.p1  ORF type:complete len:414 (+),score=96.77 TRINITY_DN9300_c0_g1_i1:60-1301(+)
MMRQMEVIVEYEQGCAEIVHVPLEATVAELRAAVRDVVEASFEFDLERDGVTLSDDSLTLADCGFGGAADRVYACMDSKTAAGRLLQQQHGITLSATSLVDAWRVQPVNWAVVQLLLATRQFTHTSTHGTARVCLLQILSEAIAQNRTDIVRALLFDCGVPVDAHLRTRCSKGPTPLMKAAEDGNVAMVEFLLQIGAKVYHRSQSGSLPMITAAAHGQCDIINLLVTEGASVNARDYRTTPLHAAASGGHVAAIELLCSLGAEPVCEDCNGNSALTAAVLAGQTDAVRCLLAEGAQVNAVNNRMKSGLETIDGMHYTALTAAVATDRVAIAELLLDSGAELEKDACIDIDGSQVGKRVPILAALKRHPVGVAMVELLIRHGAVAQAYWRKRALECEGAHHPEVKRLFGDPVEA